MVNSKVEAQPAKRKEHRTDAVATRVADKVERKASRKKTQKEDGGPPGGYDDTPLPKAPPGYTIKVTLHRAHNLPFADLNSLSSDPYVLAQINTKLPMRHKQDPHLRFRTRTIRKNVNPAWEASWIVANIPSSGFQLKARLYDEDPGNHDDRLGNVTVQVDNVSEAWEGFKERSFSIKKRMGSKRAYLFRGCAAFLSRDIHMSGDLIISVEVLGRTDGENGGRAYTLGPCNWTRHYSPLIGRLAGTKDAEKAANNTKARYNFQAVQLQLRGPVPEKLYHRYVEFKPFVAGMFNAKSLKGRVLNRALHHQHACIYNFDRLTIYGSFPEPSREMTLRFLDLVQYDERGRIFTYVLNLDGQWRFTETGKEFGIDLLSKHTMHSDVSLYVAFSGEFFVQRIETPSKPISEQSSHPPADISNGPPEEGPPRDPAFYHLIIDNDSGTYRPKNDLLPVLRDFMERNLPGLKISTLDCMSDKEKMEKMKGEQRERRKAEGRDCTYVQVSGSISSSDEEDPVDDDGAAGEGRSKGQEVREVMHKAGDPKALVMEWVHGDREKEAREQEERMAAAVAEGRERDEKVRTGEAATGDGKKAGAGAAVAIGNGHEGKAGNDPADSRSSNRDVKAGPEAAPVNGEEAKAGPPEAEKHARAELSA